MTGQILDEVLSNCDALLEAWYPGTMGGNAVASLLLGEKIPCGKLTQSFPRHAGQVPIAYNFRRTFNRIEHNDLESGPQFPFGFGLSYTTFEYSQPEADRKEYQIGDSVQIKVKIRNTGNVTAKEIVQLYIKDEFASIIPREKELKGFASVTITAGDTEEVIFKLPSELFKIYNNKMQKTLEPGTFKIMTGGNSTDLQETTIRFK